MAIRSFKLTNKNGVVWDLNNPDSFFHSVSGLGSERDYEFETVGTAYLEIDNKIKQPNPTGTITFKDYATSNEFAKFIQYGPHTLSYKMPDVDTEYFMQVNVQRLSKEEMISGTVSREITLVGNGQFYRLEIDENEASTATGKVYPYTYPYTYADSRSGSVILNSDSELPSPCKLTVFGPSLNPSWVHYLNGVVIATGKVNCSVASGRRLVIDTTVIPYSIKQFDSNLKFISDCYGMSDFSTQRFIKLLPGVNEISFSHEGAEDLHVVGEGRIIYESI